MNREMKYSPSFRTSTTKIWTGEKSMYGAMALTTKQLRVASKEYAQEVR